MESLKENYEMIECEFTAIEADSGAWVFVVKSKEKFSYEGALEAMSCFIANQQTVDASFAGPDDTIN